MRVFTGYSGVSSGNARFAAFNGAWEDYCDKEYCDSASLRSKCKKCPVSLFGKCLTPSPESAAGKLARGLPQSYRATGCGGAVVPVPTPGTGGGSALFPFPDLTQVLTPPPPQPGAPGTVTVPGMGTFDWKTLALIGTGVALVGTVAFTVLRRPASRSMAGLRKAKRIKRRN